MGTITVTLKIDKEKKKAFYDFCHEQGLLVNKFFEKAAENEMERYLLNESANVFAGYEKKKKDSVDFDEVVKTIKAKKK
ncbi:MAG: hypothetical protein LLG37_07375 [Spirochaetia bacterium]|nr:hypothetical protein [Spirochaetia bacterium]